MSTNPTARYQPQHHVRIVTAASLFDGHDAAINVMRRIMQSAGVEVIHLGHNRSVQEIVDCAVQEDAQAIALTSYQGGHIEYFKYMFDLLKEAGARTKIFGGGGGTILPREIEELHAYGIARIYSPDDGRALGLTGMIDDVIKQADFQMAEPPFELGELNTSDHQSIARVITTVENFSDYATSIADDLKKRASERKTPVLGVTGTGGAGKSSLVDELVRRYLADQPADKTIAVVSVDPSKRKSGGALLGDRIRMNAVSNPRVYMRSLATRQSNLALSRHVQESIDVLKVAGFDLIIVETSGIGQSDTEITEHSDVSLYVMTSDYGAATQLEKIDMLDFADVIAINKFDKAGSLDALRDVKKQYKRNHQKFDTPDEALPIYGTIASLFADGGTDTLYRELMKTIAEKTSHPELGQGALQSRPTTERLHVIPADRVRYLAEITERSDQEERWIESQAAISRTLYQLHGSICALRGTSAGDEVLPTIESVDGDIDAVTALRERYESLEKTLDHRAREMLQHWPALKAQYAGDVYTYEVRGKTFEQDLTTTSLSGTRVPKVSLPQYRDWGDVLRWVSRENVPGQFPFAAGVFPLRRQGEDPARMFAGEGGPERTNKRFHYVSEGLPAKRLSTAFDSVTLYGEDPDPRPDIYGKVGNSGVSVCQLDDAKKLYSGFDLVNPRTSVSMTINGPAPMLLGFFLNAAVDQGCEKYIKAEGLEADVEKKIAEIYRKKKLRKTAILFRPAERQRWLGIDALGDNR